MHDEFGARMKLYEQATRQELPPRTYTIIRVDGRAFHTFLRRAHKPFDVNVIAAMDTTAVALCREISGARFAYTQSDEISLLLTDLDQRTQPWFGGVVQKMASVAASIATAAFNDMYTLIQTPEHLPGPHADFAHSLATFDARVYTIPSRIEVANYFLWRQKDAIRNAVSMAGHAHFSARAMHGQDTGEVQEMLFREHSINFKTAYGDRERRGGVVTRQTYWVDAALPVRKVGPKTRGQIVLGEPHPVRARRSRWVASASADFTLDNGGFLAENIPQEPADALQPVPAPCAHEAWEETPGGIPHRCNDCDHLFTKAEADARRVARR